jgi:peptide/nickel transport system ATP-binding protein
VLNNPHHDYTRRLLDAAPARHSGRLQPSAGAQAAAAASSGEVLRATSLAKTYTVGRGRTSTQFLALADADLTVRTGTTHAIVGESGAGKSTLAGILAGFTASDAGSVLLGDQDVTGANHSTLRELRRDLQFVFQNPYTSLDPRYTVERIIAEPLRAFKVTGSREELAARVTELLQAVSLDESYLHRLPGQLSGGQRQRVAIARAVALNPRVLVLDEAVSALDVSVQAQILQLLVDLQARLGLSYVFVTHDLGVVRLIADDVTVMKDGRVVESGPASRVLNNPHHDYTRTLLEAIPGTHVRGAAA